MTQEDISFPSSHLLACKMMSATYLYKHYLAGPETRDSRSVPTTRQETVRKIAMARKGCRTPKVLLHLLSYLSYLSYF